MPDSSSARAILRAEASNDLREAVASYLSHLMAIFLRSRGVNLGDTSACRNALEHHACFGQTGINVALDRAIREAPLLTAAQVASVAFD